MIYTIMRSQGVFIVSATKEIIETHVATNHYKNYSERVIERTAIQFHYTMGTMSKLTVTSMNFKK